MMIGNNRALIAKTRRWYGTRAIEISDKIRFENIEETLLSADKLIKDILPTIKLKDKYGSSMDGKNRYVCISRSIVLKVPKNVYGVIDNLHEARLFKTENDTHLARCKIKLINGLPVLIMQKLTLVSNETHTFPDWAQCVESKQVGLDKYGRWKAYDYGLV